MNSLTENEISFIIRGAIFTIYNRLGPGLLESVYEITLRHELKKKGLSVKQQVVLPLIYDGIHMDTAYRIDLLVEERVIIEVKSVERLMEVHHKQLLTYLRLSGLKLGLLVNFSSAEIDKSIFRKVNDL